MSSHASAPPLPGSGRARQHCRRSLTALVASAVTVGAMLPGMANAAPTVQLGTDLVHDAAWTTLYLHTKDGTDRVVSTVLQDVANQTYRTSPEAPAREVNAELTKLGTALKKKVGSYGPTLDEQFAASLTVLLDRPKSERWTRFPAAAIAVDRYQQRLRSPIDRGVGRTALVVSDDVVDVDATAKTGLFRNYEDSVLSGALACARSSRSCLGTTDHLLPIPGASIGSSAKTLIKRPGVREVFAQAGITLNKNGSGKTTRAKSIAASMQLARTVGAQTEDLGRRLKAVTDAHPAIAELETDASQRKVVAKAAGDVITAVQDGVKTSEKVIGVLEKVLPKVDPVNGKKIADAVNQSVKVVQAGIDVCKAVQAAGSIIGGLTSAAGAAAMGNFVGAAINLVQVFMSFGSTPPPDPVFEATKVIKKQIDELHKDMSQRFDLVDHRMSQILDRINQGFSVIDADLKQIHGDLDAVRSMLNAQLATINVFEQRVGDLFKDSVEDQLKRDIDFYLGYRKRLGRDLSATEFARGEAAFFTAATRTASGPALAQCRFFRVTWV